MFVRRDRQDLALTPDAGITDDQMDSASGEIVITRANGDGPVQDIMGGTAWVRSIIRAISRHLAGREGPNVFARPVVPSLFLVMTVFPKSVRKKNLAILHLIFRRFLADSQSHNPQRSVATPAVVLNRLNQISPEF